MNEATLNKKVVDWINSLGPECWAYKRRGTAGNRGRPDVSGSICAIRVEIEGKLPGNTPTKKQAYELKKYKELGFITGWYDSFGGARELVIAQAARYGIVITREGRAWQAKRAA